jgi:two-component system, OmpR family, KDP operon response regulator KdpE
MPARTTTSRSRSAWRSCWHGAAPRCAASSRRLVSRDGEPIHLTPTEYGLLEAFVTNPGKLLTHQWLLRKVWGQGYGTETTYLRTYVRALRKKLGDDAQAPDLIVTEPGVGYRWVAEHTPEAG